MGGNIPRGNFLDRNFLGGDFPGGSLMGGNFPGEYFRGGSFPDTISTTRPQNLLMNCIFKPIYLLMANKLKRSQLKYLSVNGKYWKLKISQLKYLYVNEKRN